MRLPFLLLAVALACAACKKSDTSSASASSGKSSGESSGAALKDDGTPATLQVKWPVGNRYAERMEVNGDTETHLPQSPKPTAQKVNLNQEYSITVLGDRPKGGRELELEFESVEIDVTMNGKPVMNLDTKAEAGVGETSNPVAASFRQVVGAKIKFLLDESNRVEKVEGLQEFATKASAGSNPQGKAVVQSMFNEDYFKQMVDFARGLPRNPVKVGDTWPLKTDLTVPVLGVMTLDLNYTLTGWEPREKRKCAAIDFTGSISSKGASNAGAMGMTMQVESGRLSGKTWFDPDLGHPVETQINQDLVMHMTVPIPRPRNTTNTAAQLPASQNITNNTKQKIVIKLAEVTAASK